MSQLSAGATAPDFELPSINGALRKLHHAVDAGPIALVFYKASCPTSQFTFPYIQKIYSIAPKESPVRIWAISQDEPVETKEFIARFGIEFDVLIDEHPYRVSQAYGLEFVPAVFIIEKDVRIALSDFGFTKASLNAIAGYEFMKPDDGLPASRPG